MSGTVNLAKRSQAQKAKGSRGEPLMVVLLNDMLPDYLVNIHVYTYRSGMPSVLVREACFCSGQKLSQRFTTCPRFRNK